MTKRVYRYFFDFLDGQMEWLNQMAAQGWQLVKCRQLSYEFESCAPDEYEYSVEFVADKSFTDSKDYKGFLESMGYKVFYKNLNVGVAVGKVKWRPWATGAGQIVTAPGGYFKELLIVEKKKDGTPFELHTDLTDKLSLYRKIRNACLWTVGSMLALIIMCLSFAVGNLINGSITGAVFSALGMIPCVLFGLFWLKPLRRISAKIRIWEDEAKTNEYEPANKAKKILGFIACAALLALFGITMFWVAVGGVGTYSSGSALMLMGDSGQTHWNASYSKLNGFRQRSVSLNEGTHTFTVEIVTNSGELSFSIKGKDGTVYYNGSPLSTSTFNINVDVEGKDKVTLRVDAKSHSGSYKVNWEESYNGQNK